LTRKQINRNVSVLFHTIILHRHNKPYQLWMDLLSVQNDWRLNWKNHVVLHSMTMKKKNFDERTVRKSRFQKDLFMWVYVLTVYFSFSLLIIIVCFVSLRKDFQKKKEIEPIYFRVVCVSQRDLCLVKKRGERIKEMEFPVCLCFRIICRLFFFLVFLWVDAVFFFMPPSVSLFIY